jgi:hypothetical protein
MLPLVQSTAASFLAVTEVASIIRSLLTLAAHPWHPSRPVVMPDGQRFLVITVSQDQMKSPITVVVHGR